MDSMGKLAILFTLAIQRSFPVFSQHCKGPKWQGLPEQEINLLQPGAMVVLCLVFFILKIFENCSDYEENWILLDPRLIKHANYIGARLNEGLAFPIRMTSKFADKGSN